MKSLVLAKFSGYNKRGKRKNFYFFLAKEGTKMKKHTKEELELFAERLAAGKINLNNYINTFTLDERKYLEKKCKLLNLQSVSKPKEGV